MAPTTFGPRFRVVILFCAFVTALFGLPTYGQLIYDGNQNLPPYGGFAGGQFDTVVLQNGGLHLHIPIGSWQQRGGKTVWFNFEGDSASSVLQTTVTVVNGVSYFHTTVSGGAMQLGTTGNMWSLGSGGLISSPISSEYCPADGTNENLYDAWVLTDPEGVQHALPLETHLCGNYLNDDIKVGPTQDGTGMMVNIGTNPMLTLKDGTQIPLTCTVESCTAVQKEEDTNGNLLTTVDTLERPIITASTGSGGSTVYTIHDSGGNPQTYTINFTTMNVVTNFCGTNNNPPYHTCNEYNYPNFKVPSELVLPNGAAYQFSWINNSPGELASITLPTGATISYGYGKVCLTAPPLNTSQRYPPTTCRMAVTSRTETIAGTNNTWTYGYNLGSAGGTTTVTDPLGNQQVHGFSQLDVNTIKSTGTVEVEVDSYKGLAASGTLLRKVVTAYTGEEGFQTSGTTWLANIRPISVTTTLDNGFVCQTQTDYETFTLTGYTWTRTNPTEVREYDCASGAPGPLLRKTDYTYLHNSNSAYATLNIVDRPLTITVYNGAGTMVSQTQNEYDIYTAGIAASGAVQHDTARGSSYTTRGNVTAVKKWRNTDGALLTTRNQYDDAGNVVTQTDPLNNSTQFSYTDSWSSLIGITGISCAPSSGQTKAFLTQVTNALSQKTNHSYFSCTGLESSMTDANTQPTSYFFDMFERPTEVTYADGGVTRYCYTDVGGSTCTKSSAPFSVITTQAISSSQNLTAADLFDGLGRPTQQQLTSDPGGVDYTLTTYDAIGRVASVSNPYRSGETAYSTNYQYDAINRATQVTDPDGSKFSHSYAGNCVTTTDEASKTKQSCSDGLGRLTQVTENPGGLGYVTTYGYDALNDLTSVVQNGSRTRTFTYNSLSQLTSATNPESGTTCYGTVSSGVCQQNGYDAAGNLIYRTDARGILTTNTYDYLNRMYFKSYSDHTPAATFVWDATEAGGITGLTNTVGRMVEALNGNAAVVNSYDAVGRVASQWECSAINCDTGGWFLFGYTYNLIGKQSSITYESFGCGSNCSDGVFTLTNSFDGAGRVTGITSTINEPPLWPPNLISNVTYNAASQITAMTYGNGFTETRAYNSRLQPCRLNLNTSSTTLATCTAAIPSDNKQDYNYGYNLGTADNGNVATWTATGISGSTQTFNRSYTYDALNRLSTMTAPGDTCSGASWSFDAWGNRTAQTPTSGTCPSWSQTYTASNQIQGYSYDAAGNVLNDGSHSYTFDAENNVTQVDGGATATYVYNALNQRVEKSVPSATYPHVYYWYDTGGHIRTQWDQAGVYMADYWYLDGEFMGEYSTFWVFKDHLGTSRIFAEYTGAIGDSMDFMPFGEQIAGGSATEYKFTGQERDPESNLDFFNARHYKNAFGRFMSPDPSGISLADATDPQQFNLYSYARNNPLNFIDPTGLDCVYFNDAGDAAEYIDHNSNDTECAQNNGTWVNGYATNSGISYNAGTDMFTIHSWDDNGDSVTNYTTTASAPGSQTSGNDCYEDCVYDYSQSTLDLSSSWWTGIKSFFTLAGGPGNKPTCAAQTLRAMGAELFGTDGPAASKAETALKAGSAFQAARAIKYAANRVNTYGGTGLICPTCSRVFNRMMSKAGVLGDLSEAAPVVEAAVAAVRSTPEVGGEARSGECSAAFPVF